MKKVTLLLLMAVCLLIVSSCGSEKLKIEDHTWYLYTAVKYERIDGELPQLDPVCQSQGRREKVQEDAPVVECVLTAEDGKFTIWDQTNDRKYEGTYLNAKKDGRDVMFDLLCGTWKGYAVLSVTDYEERESVDTLVVTLSNDAADYTIYFY